MVSPYDHISTLRNACRAGNLATVRKGVEAYGVDAFCVEQNPLKLAAEDQGHPDLCRYMLDVGFPVDGFDNGFTPLMRAADFGNSELCLMFLEDGADPDTRRPSDGKVAVQIAEACGHESAASVIRAWQAKAAARNALSEMGIQP